MKSTTRPNQGVVVIHGANAAAVLKSIELSKGKKRLTINAAIDLWVSWLTKNARQHSAAQSISYIRAWARDAKVGTMPVSDIEEEHINEWVNADDGTKLGTRRVRLAIVRSFFKHLARKELLTAHNPSTLAAVDFNALSHKQKEAREIKPFTPAEFDRLVNHLNQQLQELQPKIAGAKAPLLLKRLMRKREFLTFWKCAAVISRCAGLRMGDICQLEWDCFGQKFTVWTAKRNKRVQPYIWNQGLFDATVAQIPAENPQYCFPTHRAAYLDVKRRPGLNTQFARLCDRLGLPGHTFHCLRRTYATECFKAGIPVPHISKSMGHSHAGTTEGYIHKT